MSITVSLLTIALCVLNFVFTYCIATRRPRRNLHELRGFRRELLAHLKEYSHKLALIEIDFIEIEQQRRDINYTWYQLTRPLEVEGSIAMMIAEKKQESEN